MKIKQKEMKETCCGDHFRYQLDGWDTDDWLCADCFLEELMNNGYEVIPDRSWKILKEKLGNDALEL